MPEPERDVRRGLQAGVVEVVVTPKGTACYRVVQRELAATGRHEWIIARVLRQAHRHRALDAVLLAGERVRFARAGLEVVGIEEVVRVGVRDIRDPGGFQLVLKVDPAGERQGLAQADRHAGGFQLVVVVVPLTAVDIETEREAPVHEPRLGKRQFIVRLRRANLRPQPQLLAPAGEIRPAEKVEVALGELHEPDQVVHAREARPDHELACAFLGDIEHQVPLRLVGRRLRQHAYRFEEAQVAQAPLAALHPALVVDLARIDQQLTPDDLVARTRVAADDDVADLDQFALAHPEGHIHDLALAIRQQHRARAGIEIAAVAIEQFQLAGGGLDGIERGYLALVHHLLGPQLGLGKERDAFQLHAAEAVAFALADVHDRRLAGLVGILVDRHRDIDIHEPLVHIQAPDIRLDLVQLETVILLFEEPAPGVQRGRTLERLAHIRTANLLTAAFHADVIDIGTRPLVEREGQPHQPARLVDGLEGPGSGGLGILLLAVLLDHCPHRHASALVVHQVAILECQPLAHLRLAEGLDALDPRTLEQPQLRPHGVDQPQLATAQFLHAHIGLRELTGLEQPLDILRRQRPAELAVHRGAHMRKHIGLVAAAHALLLDRDLLDARRRRRAAGQQQHRQQEAPQPTGGMGMAMDVGCWMLDVGCWALGVGCWALGVGCSVFGLQSSVFSLASTDSPLADKLAYFIHSGTSSISVCGPRA